MIKDFPHIVDIYTTQLKQCKYIPRLYRSQCREEVWSILRYGQTRTDKYLLLNPRDLLYIYTDADRRTRDEEVQVAGWIMDFIEAEKPWNQILYPR